MESDKLWNALCAGFANDEAVERLTDHELASRLERGLQDISIFSREYSLIETLLARLNRSDCGPCEMLDGEGDPEFRKSIAAIDAVRSFAIELVRASDFSAEYRHLDTSETLAKVGAKLHEIVDSHSLAVEETDGMASEDSNMGQMMRAQLRREKERASRGDDGGRKGFRCPRCGAWATEWSDSVIVACVHCTPSALNPKGPIHGTD